MTWPNDDQLTVTVEAFILDEWVVFDSPPDGEELSADHRLRAQGIPFSWGISDEGTLAQPTSIGCELWNDDGWLTPGNRQSPYWAPLGQGGWGLNTPLRVKFNGTVAGFGDVSQIEPEWPEGDVSVEGGGGVLEWDGEPVLWDGDPIEWGSSEITDLGVCNVRVTAAGEIRRLVQRTKPLRSDLTRAAVRQAGVVAHWPFEDGNDAISVASGLGNKPGGIEGFNLASDGDSFPGAEPLPLLPKGSAGSWWVPIAAWANGLEGAWSIDWFWKITEQLSASGPTHRIMDISTINGSVVRWCVDLIYNTYFKDTSLVVRGWEANTTVPIVEAQYGPLYLFFDRPLQFRFTVVDGSWSWGYRPQGYAWITLGDPFAGTAGYPNRAQGQYAEAAGDVTMGPVVVHSTDLSSSWATAPAIGHAGETAGTRMRRLCAEEGVSFVRDDSLVPTTQMGPQGPGGLMDLLTECAEADGGFLFEQKAERGLQYRPRRGRYNRAPVVTLDAAKNEIANPFVPVLDDQKVTNDVTVSRIGGSSSQATRPASIAAVGLYDESVSLSLFTDRQTEHQAGWRVHVGTAAGHDPRIPQVTVDLGLAPWRLSRMIGMTVGDRVRVINLPPQHPAWPTLELIVLGSDQTIDPDDLKVTYNTVSAKPWDVAKWGVTRWGLSTGYTLNASIDSDDTSMVVNTPGPYAWTTDAAHFPFDMIIGDVEQVTVTAISAPTGDLNTFTIIRNINGLARAHAAGMAIDFAPAYAGVVAL